MIRTSLAFLCVLSLSLAACASSRDGQGGADDKSSGQGTVIGIDPMNYKCEHLVSLDEVGRAVGGEVRVMEVAFEPPPGTAEPCHYLRKAEDGGSQQPWSFDMDCRKDALKVADKLFDQYKITKVDDAGAPTNETSLVEIGRKAMDHHGQALIVVDDDTDCYLRVLGPSAEGRVTLGKLLVGNLTMKNAPMTPRSL